MARKRCEMSGLITLYTYVVLIKELNDGAMIVPGCF
jgi:hypothetical protein